MGTEADAELVARARAGDRLAFGELVTRHGALLRGLVARLVRDPGLVDDAVQDAVVTALAGLDRLRDPGAFGPWLAGIGLNAGRRLLRGRGSATSLEAVFGGLSGPVVIDPAPSPEAVAVAAELAARVAAAVAALPAGQASAVGHFYLADLSYAETAEHLGVPIGAVKTRLHKARGSLRSALAEFHLHRTGEPEDDMAQPDTERVRMRIADVRRVPDPDGGQPRHVVLLVEDGGPARLPMWIGPAEATSLALALGGVELPRPSSYRMVAGLLRTTSVAVVGVTISDLVASVFMARIDTDAGSVDARPSDALNLALVLDVPIHASRQVLDGYARRRPDVDLDPAGDGHDALAAEAVAALTALLGRRDHGPRSHSSL